MHKTSLRRVLAVGLLALLVATAGCSGLPVLGDEESGPTGYGVAGDELNGTVLDNESAAAIDNAGSYTADERIYFEYPDDENITFYEQLTNRQVDLDDETGIRETETRSEAYGNTTNQSAVVYTADNSSYKKQIDDEGEVSYSADDDRYSFIDAVNVTGFHEGYGDLVAGLALENEGDETFDGVGVTRYEADSLDNKTKLFDANDTVDSVSATLLIDENGIVRQLNFSVAYELEGETVKGSIAMTVTAVGETTVEEPDWLGEAKADE